MSIANSRQINILKVEAGYNLHIDKYITVKVLSPAQELVEDINDNSIVMKLEYNNFSCLFTGDISKNVEKNLINTYDKYIKSDILKVAHHRIKNII